jgi:Fuc2NAc and GlcNAc transferase
MKDVTIFLLFFLSIFLSAAGAWFIGKYGQLFNLLDKPNTRSSHRTATPKGGGLGLLAAFLAASFLLGLPAGLWLPAAVVAGISFMGDRNEISPAYRLFFQFAAGIIFLAVHWKSSSQPPFNLLMIMPLALFITTTANYYNFMDGINGIAGLTGLIGFGLLAVFAHSRDADTSLKLLAICLSLSCLGFLPFNMPQARVFMGDVGSILLGFLFAVIVISVSRNVLEFISLACFLFPFYADEITTEIIRLKDGEKLWTPHRRHLYQILTNEYGIAHWKISAGYGMVQLFGGISVFFMLRAGIYPLLVMISGYFVIFTLISGTIRYRLVKNSKNDI